MISKQKRAMHRGMRKPICYDAHLIELNDYLDVFSGAKISDKICVTDLNNFFNSTPNSWIKQAYVQVFYY